MTEIEEAGFGKWDTDHLQTMTTGDYQAFIWGPDAKTDEVHIYKVEHISTSDHRHVFWKRDTPYVQGNGKVSVGHRRATFLSADHFFPKKMLWSVLRTRLGYSEKYVPRGNQKVKDFEMIDGIL
jgi:hypothetical protein